MAKQVFAAVDLGASSGRVLGGLLDQQRLELAEVHRFDNGPVVAHDRLYWDVLEQWKHVQTGLAALADRFGGQVVSVGVDTWGVDYGLLGPGDELLGNPYHYRDRRTQGMLKTALSRVGRAEIFAETGLQFMEINTLYQLLAMREQNPRLLDTAEMLLMIPDLFHWLLTGEKVNEVTDASTTQFYNPRTRNWATSLFERLDLPARILGSLAEPGTRLGALRPAVRNSTGLKHAEVTLPPSHDTASAVLAVPASERDATASQWCYISSGTWSLMGVEVAQPVINDRCLQLNFTNEGGVGGTTRLLKNIAGLWLLQECRRIWNQQGDHYDWDRLVTMAQQATPLSALIDPDDGRFVAPQDMPTAIASYCSKTSQTPPDSHAAIVRCVLESLALRYRAVLGWLETLTGARIDTIHIVGGGSQNHLLCQMAADACDRLVLAGPVEATAIGNVLMQAIAHGTLEGVAAARALVGRSFQLQRYEPRDTSRWTEAFSRFQSLSQ